MDRCTSKFVVTLPHSRANSGRIVRFSANKFYPGVTTSSILLSLQNEHHSGCVVFQDRYRKFALKGCCFTVSLSAYAGGLPPDQRAGCKPSCCTFQPPSLGSPAMSAVKENSPLPNCIGERTFAAHRVGQCRFTRAAQSMRLPAGLSANLRLNPGALKR
jgi:hypothetical protein